MDSEQTLDETGGRTAEARIEIEFGDAVIAIARDGRFTSTNVYGFFSGESLTEIKQKISAARARARVRVKVPASFVRVQGSKILGFEPVVLVGRSGRNGRIVARTPDGTATDVEGGGYSQADRRLLPPMSDAQQIEYSRLFEVALASQRAFAAYVDALLLDDPVRLLDAEIVRALHAQGGSSNGE